MQSPRLLLGMLHVLFLYLPFSSSFVFQYYHGTCANLSDLLFEDNYGEGGQCLVPPVLDNEYQYIAHQDDCKQDGVVHWYKEEGCQGKSIKEGFLCLSPNSTDTETNEAFVIYCPCKPSPKMNRRQCEAKMKSCLVRGPLRWTGKGCRDAANDNKPMYDGGCQCASYCGFSCKEACESKLNRKYCQWNREEKKCTSKIVNNKPAGGNSVRGANCPSRDGV